MKKNYIKPRIGFIVPLEETTFICESQIDRSEEEVEEFDTKQERNFNEGNNSSNSGSGDLWDKGWSM